ncbi:MAG: hypothetical protein JW963_03775 [Anaerolineales bacterium]|nr:hypothetical protein [Anaerolineales bacterium]
MAAIPMIQETDTHLCRELIKVALPNNHRLIGCFSEALENEDISTLSKELIEVALHKKLKDDLPSRVGEYLAIKILEKNGATNIKLTKNWIPRSKWSGRRINFGHLITTWKRKRYVIEIKTQFIKGPLNSQYDLVSEDQVRKEVPGITDDKDRAKEYYSRVKEYYDGAIPAWIVVSIDSRQERSVCSIYFGTVEKINWNLSCRITSNTTNDYVRFAENKWVTDIIEPTCCDILLITPLEEEFEMLEPAFQTSFHKQKDVDFFYHAKSPKSPYKIDCLLLGETGPMHAAVKTMSAILYCKPRLVVLIGIGGALARGLRLGDVVIGNEINLYFADAKAQGTQDYYKLHHSGRTWQTTAKFINVVQNFRKTNKVLFQGWQNRVGKYLDELKIDRDNYRSFTRTKPILTLGKIASGDIVGSAKSFSLELTAIDRKFKVIEMEAAGVAEACVEREDALDFLIIRGISDFADERKSELDEAKDQLNDEGTFRRLAMFSATHFFLSLLQSKIFQRCLPPSY